jgi:hypothetical protein
MEEINVTTPYGSWIIPLHRHITILTGPNASGKSSILEALKNEIIQSTYINFEERGKAKSKAMWAWSWWVRERGMKKAGKDDVLTHLIHKLLFASPYVFDIGDCGFYLKRESKYISFEKLHTPFLHIIGLYAIACNIQQEYLESNKDLTNMKGTLKSITLIADQPSLGLHVTQTKRVIKDLTSIAPDIRFVFATHDPAFIDDVNWDYVVDVTKLKPVTKLIDG